jgi:alpha-beta hydrolase superfamily lysophospholipase
VCGWTRMSMRATNYKSTDVDGISIFHSETGSPDAPNLLLLHGFPSSSRMYELLFTHLADAFHLVAPDYPGLGHSEAPDPTGFDYTFDNIARIIERRAPSYGPLQRLYAGLRRTRRVPPGSSTSRSGGFPGDAERGCSRGRIGATLANPW